MKVWDFLSFGSGTFDSPRAINNWWANNIRSDTDARRWVDEAIRKLGNTPRILDNPYGKSRDMIAPVLAERLGISRDQASRLWGKAGPHPRDFLTVERAMAEDRDRNDGFSTVRLGDWMLKAHMDWPALFCPGIGAPVDEHLPDEALLGNLTIERFDAIWSYRQHHGLPSGIRIDHTWPDPLGAEWGQRQTAKFVAQLRHRYGPEFVILLERAPIYRDIGAADVGAIMAGEHPGNTDYDWARLCGAGFLTTPGGLDTESYEDGQHRYTEGHIPYAEAYQVNGPALVLVGPQDLSGERKSAMALASANDWMDRMTSRDRQGSDHPLSGVLVDVQFMLGDLGCEWAQRVNA